MTSTENAEIVLRDLRNVQAKYADKFTFTGEVNISSMARDSANTIELLLNELKTVQMKTNKQSKPEQGPAWNDPFPTYRNVDQLQTHRNMTFEAGAKLKGNDEVVRIKISGEEEACKAMLEHFGLIVRVKTDKCIGKVVFYDHALTQEEMKKEYAKECKNTQQTQQHASKSGKKKHVYRYIQISNNKGVVK